MVRWRNGLLREGASARVACLERMNVQATQSAVVLDVLFERCEDVIVLRPRDHWPSGLKIVQVILGCWAACFAAYVSGQAGFSGACWRPRRGARQRSWRDVGAVDRSGVA